MKRDNIVKLLKLYFIENGRRDLMYLIIPLALIAFVFSFLSTGGLHFLGVLFVGIFVARLFESFTSSAGIHYLMVPANTKEKILSSMILANIYAPVVIFSIMFVSNILAKLLRSLLVQTAVVDGGAFFSGISLGQIVFLFAGISILFFGSVYFRKKSFLKTVSVCLGVSALYSTIIFITAVINYKIVAPEFESFHYESNLIENMSDAWTVVLALLVMAFFYVLSFIRLRETEV